MTIEPTEFDMVALARRGLQALLDEAVAEVEFARRYATVDITTRRYTPEAKEAKSKALDAFGIARIVWPASTSCTRSASWHDGPSTVSAPGRPRPDRPPHG